MIGRNINGYVIKEFKGKDKIIKPITSSVCEYKQKYMVTSSIIKGYPNTLKRRKDDIFSKL